MQLLADYSFMLVNRMLMQPMSGIIQVTGMLLELDDSDLLDLLRPEDVATGAAALLEKAPLDLPATPSDLLSHLPAVSTRTHGVSARSRNICCAGRPSHKCA